MAQFLPFTGSTPFDIDLQETLVRKRAGPEQRRRDVATWNIYADWLEDSGKPNRAAFVRKYIESALELVRRVNRLSDVTQPVRLPGRWSAVVEIDEDYGPDDFPDRTVTLLLSRPHARRPSKRFILADEVGVRELINDVAELCTYVEKSLRMAEREGRQGSNRG